jgi:hypothetical protein
VLGSTGPLERKVTAATAGSGAGVAFSGLLLWLLDTYLFTASEVPAPVAAAVLVLPPVIATFLGGVLARHTPRYDRDSLAAPPGQHRAGIQQIHLDE